MNFKLIGPIIENGCNLVCFVRSGRQSTFKSRLSGIYRKKVRSYSSKPNQGGLGEEKLKELLDASSPLEPSREALEFWATSPFAKGTVFKKTDDDESDFRVDTNETQSIIMFPGQGNQFVGMARKLKKVSVANDMFAAASEILGYDLLKVCMEGPEEKLNETEYCQPATFVCSLAALELLKEEKPWAINNCVATCGYSLGELSALVFGGCLNFEKGVELVKIRAEAMSLCSKAVPGGMMTIMCGVHCKLSEALKAALEHCQSEGIDDAVCSIASYLFPACKVISGNIEALNFLIENAEKFDIRKHSILPVSGAFHTKLMMDAVRPFEYALSKIKLRDPLIKIYSNVQAAPYRNAAAIEKTLPKQIYMPVKWEQTLQTIYARPTGQSFPFTYEVGPGSSLTALLRKVNRLAMSNCYSVKL